MVRFPKLSPDTRLYEKIRVLFRQHPHLVDAKLLNPMLKDACANTETDLKEAFANFTSKTPPDVISYLYILRAYGNRGDLDGMHKMLQEMQAKNIVPNTHIYNCLIQNCIVQGNYKRAKQYLGMIDVAHFKILGTFSAFRSTS